MIRRALSLLGILCISTLLFTDANAKGKPDKPDEPGKTHAEHIIFSGDLESVYPEEPVEGCCPNAGPFPTYTMFIRRAFEAYGIPGQYDGQLFISGFGAGRYNTYRVQFWVEDEFLIEIIGGDGVLDRKTKRHTVTFSDVEGCLYMPVGPGNCVATEPMSFVLERYPAD